MMGKVLIIDDNPFNAEALCDMVRSMGYEVANAYTAEDGLRASCTEDFDVVFLDVQLPDGNGLALLPEIHAMPSAPEVIIITGFGSPDGAEMAIKNGAWDFIEKPIERNLIELPIARAMQYRDAKKQREVPMVLKRDNIIGSSPKLEACMKLVAQAAVSDVAVLITGETGTGKELFAQAIHENSPRVGRAFVIVDCASLPPTIIESILLGHEKGAFTGADKPREGLVKLADGGTLFLDEVGDLPLSAQKAFLRILQEHRYRPLGAKQEFKSEFRVIAATNRDLDRLVREGTFREDLLFRLRALTIELPPLRERPADIQELTVYYMNKICMRHATEIKGFSPEIFDTLHAYGWPGNVRELVNALESAIAMALSDPIVYPKHLPTHIRIHLARNVAKKHKTEETSGSPVKMSTLKECRESVVAREEHQYLVRLLTLTDGKIRESCKISGLNRARLYQLIKKHRIVIPSKR
jgi:two-component system, NtrC family, response regulator